MPRQIRRMNMCDFAKYFTEICSQQATSQYLNQWQLVYWRMSLVLNELTWYKMNGFQQNRFERGAIATDEM